MEKTVVTPPRNQRYRILCATLCVFESLLFGGLFFGWASLVYVLKQENIYAFLCDDSTTNQTIAVDIQSHDNGNENSSYVFSENHERQLIEEDSILKVCSKQDAKLNLWFTIAVSVLSIATSLIGWLLYRFGPVTLRCVGTATFCCGSLMLAFVDNNAPWLICPGLFFIAFGAVCISAANLQVVPYLFHRGSSVAVSLLTGFYYSAATTQWLIKIAFQNGISRQHSYTLLTVLNVVLVTGNTLLFFRESPHPVIEITVSAADEEAGGVDEDEKFLRSDKNEKSSIVIYDKDTTTNNTCVSESEHLHNQKEDLLVPATPAHVLPSLRSCVLSRTFLCHLFWFVSNDFYLLTFIGMSNAMLERILLRDKAKVNHFTDIFSFSLMCAAIFSVVGGFLYDCQRMVFRERKGSQRQYLPAVGPITMATLLGVLTITLQFIQEEVVLYPLFVMFVIYKQCVFAMTLSFIVDVYPKEYFGVFYGTIFTVAGLVLFLQYGIFTWLAASPSAPTQVNLFFLCLLLLSLANPINLLFHGLKKPKNQT